MLESCQICSNPVTHDHVNLGTHVGCWTNLHRSLCQRCRAALSGFRDNVVLLEAAISHMLTYRATFGYNLRETVTPGMMASG